VSGWNCLFVTPALSRESETDDRHLQVIALVMVYVMLFFASQEHIHRFVKICCKMTDNVAKLNFCRVLEDSVQLV
jgi:hypothetical protein